MGGGGRPAPKTPLKSKRRVNKQLCGVIRRLGGRGDESGSRERAGGGFSEGDASGWVGGQDRSSQTAVSSCGEEKS